MMMMMVGEACSTHGETKLVYAILTEKPQQNRRLDKRRHTWLDNMKTHLGNYVLG
jgi:hypothetical protein